MSTNSKKFVRKYSLKIYRSPRLLHYPIPDDPEPVKMKKEVPAQKKYNINIIKPEQNQYQGNLTVNNQEQKKIYSSTTTNKRNLTTEEKKVVIKKTPISAKNSIKTNNKGEIAIKPLNRNNSGTKIISTVKESQIQNKYINTNSNTNNQPLFYSNIDLNGYNKNNNRNINMKNINESAYIDRRRINSEVENKNQYRANSQTKPQITKVVPQTKGQIKKVPPQQNVKINLQQSKSQTNFKITSNNPSIKIRTNPIQKNANDKSIPQPQPTLRKNATNINVNSSKINKIQIKSSNYPLQNTVYISSNISGRNSNVYQNMNKIFNTSSNIQNNYRQKTQKINIPNAQNKNYRIEYKPSIQTQQINNGKNIRNNNQNYYTSQTVNRQEKSNYNSKNTIVNISDNRNKKEYNIKTKDNKPQANYDRNKKNNIYETKNVNKENHDKNKSGYSYVVNFNNIKSSGTGNKSIDATKNQRRNVVNS